MPRRLALAPFLCAYPAFAADLDTFRPAPGAWCGEGVQLEAGGPNRGEVCAAAILVYADDPLVERWGTDTSPILATSIATHLGAAWSPWESLALAVDAPIYPYVGRPESTINGGSVGDLRLAATLWRGGPRLRWRLSESLGLPTGLPSMYTGAGGVSGTLSVGAVATFRRLELTGMAGVYVFPHDLVEGVKRSSAAMYGLGGRWQATGHTHLGLEVDAEVPLIEKLEAVAAPVEIHGYGQWRAESGFTATVGAGTGLIAGLGAPDLRLFLGIGWTGLPTPWATAPPPERPGS